VKGRFESDAQVHENLERAWTALHEIRQHAADERTRESAERALVQLDQVLEEPGEDAAAHPV
jgi:hypothetical protein